MAADKSREYSMEAWRSWRDKDKPIFSEDYETQREELKTNPQLRDFRRQREELKDNIHRPNYHYVRPNFKINDPNGLCFWEGRWHLFYQALDKVTVHWGHAVSEDMVHWEDLPYAIYPGEDESCFSGTVCVDEENHRVISVYYGYTGFDFKTGYKSGIILSTSSDPLLLNWTKLNGGRPIIPDGDAPIEIPPFAPPVKNQKPYQVHDPYIWKENGVYYLLTAGFYHDPVSKRRFRQEHLHRCVNEDLQSWEYVKPLIKNDRFNGMGDDGACPNFVPIGDNKRLLLHFTHHDCMTKYLLGRYDPESLDFEPFSGGQFASGNHTMTAPSAVPLSDGSVACIFNLSERFPQNNWGGMMTLPRKLTVGGFFHDDIFQQPFADYSSLHLDHTELHRIELSEDLPHLLEGIGGKSFEMRLRMKAGEIPNALEIDIMRSPDESEVTRIYFLKEIGENPTSTPYPFEGVLMLDTTHSSSSSGAFIMPPETASVPLAADEDVFLQIFADKSIVEVYINNKRCVFDRVYPVREDSVGISLLARREEGVIDSLEFWTMGSIY